MYLSQTSTSMIDEKNIAIRQLSAADILSVYSSHSIRHFPKEELKPVSSIERMLSEGIYNGYGIYDCSLEKNALLCYALFTVPHKQRNILLDYFAVMEDYRNHGIGSLFLKHFVSSVTDYNGILIEVENPDYAADAADLDIRSRRIGFYERNGAVLTGISAHIFDAYYKLMFLPILSGTDLSDADIDTLYSDFDNIYRHMVSPENYRKYVSIFK